MADTPIGALLVRIGADIGDLVDGLDKADKAVGRFTNQLDRRLLKPMAELTGAAAAAGTALFMFTKNAADTVDQIGKLSQKVGVSVEALSGLKYAAELSDVSLQDLGQGLKQLSKFMVENNIQGVTVEEQLLKIADDFSKTADGAGKTAAAMRYFGKAGADLIPLLNQGRAGIEELRKEAERLGIVFSAEAAKKAEEFNDNLTRLKSVVTGVHIELAGPFVKALNETGKAFLEARQRGDGFFDTLSQIMLRLTMGSDAQIIERQIVKASNALLDAQNKLDEMRRKMNAAGDSPGLGLVKDFQAAERAAKEAEAELKRLVAVRGQLVPEAGPEKPGKPKPEHPFIDPVKAQRDAELIAKQLQEQADEEVRIAAETSQLMDDQRQKDLQLERDALLLGASMDIDFGDVNIAELRRQYDERNKILMEAYDREQDLAYENAQTILEAERDADKERLAMGYKHNQLDLAASKTFFGSMSLLMQTHSKKMFEIGKAAAIAETVVNTYTMAVGAYRALASIPYVGPYLGAAAAAAAVAFGTAQVQAIRSQQFGGGAVAAPVVASNPSTGAPAGTPADVGGGSSSRGPDTIIHLHGDSFGRKQIRDLLEQLNEEGRDGGRIVLAGRG